MKPVKSAGIKASYNTAGYFREKIRQLSVKYANEFELANNYNSMGYNCCVTEEIAMGIVGDGEDRKEQINEILRKADTMMYSVKHTTKHTYTFFS